MPSPLSKTPGRFALPDIRLSRVKGYAQISPLRPPGQIFHEVSAINQAWHTEGPRLGVAKTQRLRTRESWDHGVAIINDERGKRPQTPCIKPQETIGCPVCTGGNTPLLLWESADSSGRGTRPLYAFFRRDPHMVAQIIIPLSLEHINNVREVTPQGIVDALLFARRIVIENLLKSEGMAPYMYMHLGGVGSSILHPQLVMGLLALELPYFSKSRYAIAQRYHTELKRNVMWEEKDAILKGSLSMQLVDRYYVGFDNNSGFMIHTPFCPMVPKEVDVTSCRDGANNLAKLSEEEVYRFAEAIWAGIRLMGAEEAKFKDGSSGQVVNNITVLFSQLPFGLDFPLGSMTARILGRESTPAIMELNGMPVVDDPEIYAATLKALLKGGAIRDWSTQHGAGRPIVANLSPRRTRWGQDANLHLAVSREGDTTITRLFEGSRTTTSPVITIIPWHGLYSVQVTDGGLGGRHSIHEFEIQDTTAAAAKCFADSSENLGFPHFMVALLDGKIVEVVTNPFGFGGGQPVGPGFTMPSDIETIYHKEVPRLEYSPAHLVLFSERHFTSLKDQTEADIAREFFAIRRLYALMAQSNSPAADRVLVGENVGGPYAGRSVPHQHSQMVVKAAGIDGIYDKMLKMLDGQGSFLLKNGKNRHNRVIGLAVARDGILGRDIPGEQIRKARELGLVLFENKDICVCVEEAPMFPYQVSIIAKRPGANSLVHLDDEEVQSFIAAKELVRKLLVAMGIEELNMLDVSAHLNNRKSTHRYTQHYLPRKLDGQVKQIGALDMDGVFNNPVHPREAARIFKEKLARLLI